MCYILENGRPVPATPLEFGIWFQVNEAECLVDRTVIAAGEERGQHIWVSTCFIGVNAQYDPDLPPLIYETMIFGGAHHEYKHPTATLGEAKQAHLEAVEVARRSLAIAETVEDYE